MDDKETLIREYVAQALPQGEVCDLLFFDSSSPDGKRFDAQGRISLRKGRGFCAYFVIKHSPSWAALKDTIAMLEWGGGGKWLG